MTVWKEISDKKLIADALKELIQRRGSRLFVSMPPAILKKELLSDTHPWFRIVICLSGEYRFGYYDNGFKENILPCDATLITLPEALLINRSVKPFRCIQVIFKDTFIRYIFVENEITYWHHTANPLRLCGQHIVRGICEMPFSGDFDEERKKLVEVLIKISLVEIEEDSSLKKGKAFSTYHSAVEYMHENLHRELDRSKVAGICGVTPSHLSKLFRHFGQEDFKEFLKKLRLRHSMLFLCKSSIAVKEIASLCGFKTDAHFIRVFKKINGISPGRFRSLNAESKTNSSSAKG